MSITVTLGGDVHFWCKTAATFACYNMNWVYANSKTEGHPFGVLGTCRTPAPWVSADNQRLALSFDDGRFGLHISNVSYGDGGRYSCWVTKSVGVDAITEYSAVAFLTVLSPVPTPLCRYAPEVVSVGDDVLLTCGVPPDAYTETVKLTWAYDSPSPVRSVFVQRGETFSKPHTFSENDNYKMFTCVAGNDLTNGPNCTLSPLQIPMTIEITHVFDGAETKFVCSADAVPPVTNYHWSIQEMNSSSREWRDVLLDDSRTENGGTTLVLTAGRDNGLVGRRLSTTCTASNSIGLTVSSAPIRTLQCNSGAIVTELTRCEDLAAETTSTMVTEASTHSVATGSPQGTDDGIGIYIWIIVAAVLFLVIVAIVCCICLLRYRQTTKIKKTSTNNGHLDMGVAYNTTLGSVDLRSHTGTSESNALMMEAEVVLTASNSSLHQLDTRAGQTAGKIFTGVVALSTSNGLHDGETYASIDDSHQTQRASQSKLCHSAGDISSGPHKSSHDGYDTIVPDIFQQSVSFDGTTQRNPLQVDLSDCTYASVGSDQQSNDEVRLPPVPGTQPCANYESVDPYISQVQTSVRDSSSLKKVCVVSPTCHLKNGGDNQAVYAMPDKQRKPTMDTGDITKSKPVQDPSGIVYTKPDKKQNKPVQKYGRKHTNNDNASKPSMKSSRQNVPQGL